MNTTKPTTAGEAAYNAWNGYACGYQEMADAVKKFWDSIAQSAIDFHESQSWQPIETAPVGKFYVWLPTTELMWPASRMVKDGPVYSNAHGELNLTGFNPSPKATHWRYMPPAPGRAAV